MDSLMDFQMLFDTLYGEISDDTPVSETFLEEKIAKEEELRDRLDLLVEEGFLDTRSLQDETLYSASKSLTLAKAVNEPDAHLQEILMVFAENPKGFFMLGNTQNGKSKKILDRVHAWTELEYKMLGFVVVDNDRALADQFVGRLDLPVKLFRLYGTKGNTTKDIERYIREYLGDPTGNTPMPLVVLLSNEAQDTRMVRIITYIHMLVTEYQTPIKYGIIWDECDVTYKRLCDKAVDGVSIRTYMVEKTESLHEVFWISATDGSLLQEDENYPECLTAQSVPFIPDPSTQGFYRAVHTQEVTIHRKSYTKELNDYALNTFKDNLDPYMRPVKDQTGAEKFRKIIINSSSKRDDMDALAKDCVQMGMNVIVFNGMGGSASLILYSSRKRRFPLKGQPLNQLLFYLYKTCGLESKPLVVLGNRKVNRGLTFHYSPQREVTIHGPFGEVSGEGLIFTDVILGTITNEASACQKAGRGAGLIANSPQYTGMTHYWTDENTAESILAHNHMVDRVNQASEGIMREVLSHARPAPVRSNKNHDVDEDTFLVYTDLTLATAACVMLRRRLNMGLYNKDPDGFYTTARGKTSERISLITAINRTAHRSCSETGNDRLCFPCYRDTKDISSLHYVIRVGQATNVADIRAKYPPIPVPKTGKY